MKLNVLSGFHRAVIFSFLIVVIISVAVTAIFYSQEYDEQIELKHQQLDMVVEQFNQELEHSTRYLYGLRASAQKFLEDENSNAFSPISLTQQQAFYYSLPGNRTLSGSLSGKGDWQNADEALIHEWKMARSLDGAFQIGKSMFNELPWFYYLSAREFIYVYPKVSTSVWGYNDALLEYPLFTLGQAENNPAREVYATDPGTDMLNGRIMVALGAPVYHQGEHRGNLVMDFSPMKISELAMQNSNGRRVYMVVNENNYIIAHPSLVYNANNKTITMESVLPEPINDLSMQQLAESEVTSLFYNGFFIRSQQLGDLNWRVVYLEPTMELNKAMLSRFFNHFVMILVSLSALVLVFYMLTRRFFVFPAYRLIRHIERSADSEAVIKTAAPSGWQKWFEVVDNTFEQNRELLRILEQKSDEQSRTIEDKNRSINRANSIKERNVALLLSIINAIPDLIYFKNIDGSYLGCNKAFEEFIGKEETDIVGSTSESLFEYQEAMQIESQDNRILTTGLAERDIKKVKFKDGEDRIFDTLVTPFFNEQGELLGLLGIGRDITAQQRAVDALKKSEIKFRSAIEYSANGIILTDTQFVIVQINRAMSDILGYSHSELENKQLKTIFTASIWDDLHQGLQLLTFQKKTTLFKEYELTATDGRQVWVQISASVIWDSSEKPLYFVLHLRDDSEQKHYKDELELARDNAQRADAAKGEFMANMSHEIRTPMNAILGMMQLMVEEPLTGRQRDYVDKAMISANALLYIINDILDYSKADAGKLVLDKVSFDLDEVVQQAFVISVFEARRKNLSLEIQIDSDVPQILIGDKARLGQILINLINNAIKFTESGFIRVSVHQVYDPGENIRLEFSVQDSGIGIEAEKQSELFEAFTQVDSSMTRKYGGTGLGLSICKQLVELMRGRIWFDSNPGKGAVFYFTVELERDHYDQPDIEINKNIIVCEETEGASSSITVQLNNYHIPYQLLVLSNDDRQALKGNSLGKNAEYSILIVAESLSEQAVDKLKRVVEQNDLKPGIQVISDFGRAPGKLIDEYYHYPVVQKPFAFRQMLQIWQSDEPGVDASTVMEQDFVRHLGGLRVLVAEDNTVNQQVISSILESAHIDAITAENGAMAIDYLYQQPFDAVIMDIQMPVMDGITAVRRIRQNKDWKDLPVIALTAHASARDHEESIAAGMNAHITKPVHRTEILKTLCRFIEQRNVEKNLATAEPVNMAFALDQFSGNKDVFLKVLIGFEAQLLQYAESIKQGCNEDDKSNVISCLHTLKGMSGNLGMEPLSQSARKLEEALKQGMEHEALLQEFCDNQDSILDFINKNAKSQDAASE